MSGFFCYPERLLAWRYMRSRRREGFVSVITLFSVLGITLGVATLILITSLMNGIREEMIKNFAGIDGHITLYGQGPAIADSYLVMADIEGKFENTAELVHILPRIEGQVMVSSPQRALGAQVFGYDAQGLQSKDRIIQHITQGSVEGFGEGEGIVVGERLMENLGLKIGDSVTLISPQGRQTVVGMIPRIKAYPIIAAFNLGQHALDGGVILMPYEAARVYFSLPEQETGVATAIEITLADMRHATRIANDIRGMYPGLRIYDWQQSNANVFAALSIQRNVMFVILALIILVATFNIISSLIMLVQGKTREIAILRTMGATRGAVLRIFLLAGMGIGIFGTLLGFALGLLAARYIESIRHFVETVTGEEILVSNIYFLSSLPTQTDPVEVAAIVLLALALSFFATLYPAWKAASTHPAEALRYE